MSRTSANRGILATLFDRAPDRLDNGRCADCIFAGSRRVDGSWSERLHEACDWHYRHAGPWGTEEGINR